MADTRYVNETANAFIFQIDSTWGTYRLPEQKAAKLSAARHSRKFEISGSPVTVRNIETGELLATYQNGKVKP